MAKIHVLPNLTRLGIAYCGRLLLTEAGSMSVRPSRMCPLHPLSVFSISTRKISPGCSGFSLKATELAKLVVRTATVLSSRRTILSPWMGWNLVTTFLLFSLIVAWHRTKHTHPRETTGRQQRDDRARRVEYMPDVENWQAQFARCSLSSKRTRKIYYTAVPWDHLVARTTRSTSWLSIPMTLYRDEFAKCSYNDSGHIVVLVVAKDFRHVGLSPPSSTSGRRERGHAGDVTSWPSRLDTKQERKCNNNSGERHFSVYEMSDYHYGDNCK